MNKFFVRAFLEWPDSLAKHFVWLAPLFGRFVVGWIFLWKGWSDVQTPHALANDLSRWGLPYTHSLSPIFSGIELAGGIFLLLGFISRLSAGTLAIIMLLTLILTRWNGVHTLSAFVGLKETQYLSAFLWLAIAGGGPLSLDNLIQKKEH
jgi:putative oxidoreductase